MNKAIQESRYTIAILSPEYLKSRYAQSEWVATFIEDPTGEDSKLLPVRVKEFEHKGLLASIVYIDFIGLDEVTATNELLEAVKNLHGKRKLTASRLNKGHAFRATPSPFPGISSTIWNCPHRQNRYFTGRKEFLEGLRIRFEREILDSQKQPIAISGLAGIGKTQVAVEYAYRYLSKYSFILWAGASSHDMLSAALATIARLLNLYSKDVKEQELAIAALKLYLQEQSNWLLILDAVDDPEVVRALIPLSELAEHGHILITTQNPRIQEIAQKFELEKMPLEEGAFFLLRRAGIITLAAQFDEDFEDALLAKDISFSLDGLPLALDHAGAYIGQTDCGLVAYLKHYQAQAVRPTLMRYVPHPDALSVASTFTISFEKVFTTHRVSAKLLQLCAFLHHDAIPEEIITGGAVILGRSLGAVVANEVKFDEAIAALRRYSLIHRNPFENTLAIHGLVQIILKDKMTRSEHQRWAEKTVRIVSRTFPEVEHSTWPLCQKYLPHALECAKLITEWDMTFIQAGQLLHRVGQYLLERAQYSQAKLLLTKALEIYEKKLGSEDIQVAAVLDNLGSLYLKQGGQTAYTDAELHYLRSLAILEEKLGPEDPITAQSLNHLGLLYYNQGKYIQAEPRYLKAKAIQERVRENYAADLAVTLNNLAWLYYNLGRFDEVKPLLEEALAIQERPEGSESPAMATTLNALAMYYRSKGNDIEAKKIFKRALAIRVRIFGHKHPDVATTLNDLAWLYRTGV